MEFSTIIRGTEPPLLHLDGLGHGYIQRAMNRCKVHSKLRVDGTKNSYIALSERTEDSDCCSAGATYALFYKDKEIILFEPEGIIKFKAPNTRKDITTVRLEQILKIHAHFSISSSFPCLSDPHSYKWVCSGHTSLWFGFDTGRNKFFIPQADFYRGAGRVMPTISTYSVPKVYRRDKNGKKAESIVAAYGLKYREPGEVWSRGGKKWLLLGFDLMEPYQGNWYTGSHTVQVVRSASKPISSTAESELERMVLCDEPWRLVPYTDWVDESP